MSRTSRQSDALLNGSNIELCPGPGSGSPSDFLNSTLLRDDVTAQVSQAHGYRRSYSPFQTSSRELPERELPEKYLIHSAGSPIASEDDDIDLEWGGEQLHSANSNSGEILISDSEARSSNTLHRSGSGLH